MKRSNTIFYILPIISLLCGIQLFPSIGIANENISHQFSLGYRSTGDVHTSVTNEYRYLESSATLDGDIGYATDWGHANLALDYTNSKEYLGEFHLDYGVGWKLTARNETFFHRTEHIVYDPSLEGGRADITGEAQFSDQNPGEDYGVKIAQRFIEARHKIKDYPAHLNLEYWQMSTKGDRQLRFVDENCASACHFQSRSRDVDQTTNQVTGSADAHLGPIDLIISHTYRDFSEDAEVPTDSFENHLLRDAGEYQHDEEPDSRYMATTIQAHTSLSGGIVAAASATVGLRENRAKVSDVQGVRSKTDFVKGTGDFIWIASEKVTINLRQSYLLMETSNSDSLVTSSLNSLTLSPRANIDIEQAKSYSALTYRPSKRLTMKAEAEFQSINRSNTGGYYRFSSGLIPQEPYSDDPVWEMPDEELQSRIRVSLFSRPFEDRSVKLRGWFQAKRSDSPAYNNALSSAQIVFASIEFNPSSQWGAAVNGKIEFGSNKDHTWLVEDSAGGMVELERDRDTINQNYSAMVWGTPHHRINLGTQLGYQRTEIAQQILFGSEQYNAVQTENYVIESDADYSQSVETLSAHMNIYITDTLSTQLEGHYIHSRTHFTPSFSDRVLDYSGSTLTATAQDLGALSRTDIEQSGFSVSVRNKFAEVWDAGVTLRYDDYTDNVDDYVSDSVSVVSFNLGRTW